MTHYFLNLLFCLFALSGLEAQSCLCDPEDDEHSYEWYTVTAPSGLTLRATPNRNSAKLDAIPYGEELHLCRSTNFKETIEGKSGNWLKVMMANTG